MVDGTYTGKPNAFETKSAFPPVPQGLETKKPDWLQRNLHKVHFDSEFQVEEEAFWDLDAALLMGRRTDELREYVMNQAEAYLQSFLALTHLTPEELHERFLVIQSPGEIISMEDVNNNTFRYTLTLQIKPREDYKVVHTGDA